MDQLASDHRDLKNHYEVVVIGSGYGGATAASRLARAGRQTCILERGNEILPGNYPDSAAEFVKQLQTDFPKKQLGSATALFDFRYNKDISVIVGCGLGGTSLINANINEAPDPRIYQDQIWPQQLREDASNGKLAQFTSYADDMLKPCHYPKDYPPLAKQQAFESVKQHSEGEYYQAKINVSFRSGINHVGIEQQACINCGDCLSGCNYKAKNTLLMNYLPDAKNHGAEIFTQLNVRYIEKIADRWRIHVHHNAMATTPISIDADIVILAAGTLGSTEILLRSNQQGLSLSEMLGKRFSGNGDMLGIAYNTDHSINAVGSGRKPGKTPDPVGPTSTAIIDTRRKSELTNGMVMAASSMPGALAPLLPKGLAALKKLIGQHTNRSWRDKLKAHSRQLKSLLFGAYTGAVSNTQFYLSVSHDNSAGQLFLENDRLRISWPDAGDSPQLAAANQVLQNLTFPLGGAYIQNPLWSYLADRSLLTGHPIGGCVMAETATDGVVNHKGQVFSGSEGNAVHSGLYVIDGAVIPRSVGVNPLNAITTLAERSCHYLLQDYGWSTSYEFDPKWTTDPGS